MCNFFVAVAAAVATALYHSFNRRTRHLRHGSNGDNGGSTNSPKSHLLHYGQNGNMHSCSTIVLRWSISHFQRCVGRQAMPTRAHTHMQDNYVYFHLSEIPHRDIHTTDYTVHSHAHLDDNRLQNERRLPCP